MIAARAEHRALLGEIMKQTSSDFAAVASLEADHRIRWVMGVGNDNDKFLFMEKRAGRGIAGWVVRHGIPLLVGCQGPDAENHRQQYPIMLAEHLLAAAAVPVCGEGGAVTGVIMVGRRTPSDFEQQDIRLLEREARQFDVDFKSV